MKTKNQFTLYIGSQNLSSWSLRPWLVLQQFDMPFDAKVIALDRPNSKSTIAAVSPSGKVPTLVHETLVIWDSLAIVEYLAELFPEKNLWPQDRQMRAQARSVAAEMHSGFAALRKQLPMNCHRADQKRRDTIDAECRHDIARICEIWRDCRSRHANQGPFLFGPFSIADAMYAPVVIRLTTYGIALGDIEKSYAESIWQLPAMQVWLQQAKKELAEA